MLVVAQHCHCQSDLTQVTCTLTHHGGQAGGVEKRATLTEQNSHGGKCHGQVFKHTLHPTSLPTHFTVRDINCFTLLATTDQHGHLWNIQPCHRSIAPACSRILSGLQGETCTPARTVQEAP